MAQTIIRTGDQPRTITLLLSATTGAQGRRYHVIVPLEGLAFDAVSDSEALFYQFTSCKFNGNTKCRVSLLGNDSGAAPSPTADPRASVRTTLELQVEFDSDCPAITAAPLVLTGHVVCTDGPLDSAAVTWPSITTNSTAVSLTTAGGSPVAVATRSSELPAGDAGTLDGHDSAYFATDSGVVHNTGTETVAGVKTFSSSPLVPTAAPGTNTTATANTAFVAAAVAALINSAPGVLDTLDELAAALGDDANFAATLATALAGKQPLDAMLTALAALTTVADRGLYFTGADAPALFTLTAAGRALVDDADAAAQRATLGLAALAILSTVGTAQIDNDAVTYAKMQNVTATDKVLGRSTAGAGDVEEIALTAAGRALIDDADAAAQRTTLGLGNSATKNTGTSAGTVAAGDDTRLTHRMIAVKFSHAEAGDAVAVWRVPFAGTITGWRMGADASGSAVVDIWKSNYAGAPPSVGNSITASAKPTLSSAQKAESSTLTGWDTALAEGDVLIFSVDSISDIEVLDVILTVQTA